MKKNMRLILLIGICFFMSGCGIDHEQISEAESLCKDFGGVDRIYSFPNPEVVCINGVRIKPVGR